MTLPAEVVQAGEQARASELVQQLEATPQAAFGWVLYHLVCSDMDAAADWYAKAIEQRELFAVIFASAPMLNVLRVTGRWPRLAKMMNLRCVTM